MPSDMGPLAEITGDTYTMQCQQLIEIPSAIPENMTKVTLIGNPFSILPSDGFSKLTDLDELILEYNGITEIQQGAFVGPKLLKKLTILHSPITELKAGIFTGLDPENIEITISINEISYLEPGLFDGVPYIFSLSITSNKIETLHKGLFSQFSGGYITLSNNGIRYLQPGTFDGLNAGFLILSSNEIEQISAGVFANAAISALNLQGNAIHTIEPGSVSGISNLKSLWLAYNELSSLPSTVVFNADDYPESNGHPTELAVSLSGNPFICNSSLCWLKEGEGVWITYTSGSQPECTNFATWWGAIDLQCSDRGNTGLVMQFSGRRIYYSPDYPKGLRVPGGGVQHVVWTRLQSFSIIRESITDKATNGGQHKMWKLAFRPPWWP